MDLKPYLILTIIILTMLSCNDSWESIFTDEVYQDTIKQNIGGSLIRNIHHYNDTHSYNYVIQYSYLVKSDNINKIGVANFNGQKPPTDEQLIRFNKWIILKTSAGRDKDVLFISSDKSNTWIKYEISPKTIEQTALWKEQNIDSDIDNWDTVSKINNIESSGAVTVVYTYAKKNRLFSFITEERQVTYKINLQTGKLEMTRILEI